MSLRESRHTPCLPVTGVAWASNGSTCPRNFTLISATHDGSTANFVRGFGMKSGYFLCYSTNAVEGKVVSDIQVISDKEPIPHGYSYIPEYLEPKASVWKKKRVCARIVPLDSAESAVLDIKLTAKSKVVLQHYTCLGDIHGYVLWCKKGPFSKPTPQAKPRSISLDIRKLSLDEPSPPCPLRPSNGPLVPLGVKLSHRRSNLDNKASVEGVHESISMYSITAIDGIPFVLDPKFEAPPHGTVPSDTLSNIRIKSIQDIENEYNYTFAVEERAARRAPLRTSLSSPLPSPYPLSSPLTQ
ncbi:multivesicular body subunit 12A-like [Megalops cyprinoides]|uniref:multivesicular body subunit 12A-like n=1 Tax=Megalops cyprinoides TaxID=118141 RepID=UPI001863D41C|nr:multivesicular body subunit 12A-like [Megalops cyprinoides]